MISLDIKVNKERILSAAGMTEGAVAYDTVSRYFDELQSELEGLIRPAAAFKEDGKRVYCAVTVGGGVSEFSKKLFDSGEAVKGLLCDAYADECLFAADSALANMIREILAKRGLGVLRRLSAPEDFPLSTQQTILEKAGADCITVTDAFMLSPLKSMTYILELTDDADVFNAQHDCSKCKSKNCPRRSAPYSGEILSVYDYAPDKRCGDAVCIDIGTTTIAMQYIRDGIIRQMYKSVNPQRRFGADVLSRVDAANRGRGGELNALVRYAVKKGINEITRGEKPEKIIVACNTAMTHLFMDYPCNTLGAYPFKSEHLKTTETDFDGIPMTVIGGVSAFVGGDIVSGMYMTDFDLSDRVNLFIDLGTNGEMAIGNRDRIIVTSTAAGPAFEGGRLSFSANGTDVIDIMARLLDKKIMDSTGKLADKYFKGGYRLNKSVTVTQQDIREIQTAKAAVRAGVECLMRACGTEDIDTVYLAGGMGCRLSAASAVKIGLLPQKLMNKIKAVGNSSLGGAVKYACEDGFSRIENIRKISDEFPLASHRDFERLYLEYMNF